MRISTTNDCIVTKYSFHRLNLEETREKDVNSTTNKDFLPTDNLISLYTCITILMIAIALSTSYAFYNLCMKASNNLHNSMFSKIVYATMFFFNTTPSGRILNRFSKDMGSVDEMLPLTLGDALQVSSSSRTKVN